MDCAGSSAPATAQLQSNSEAQQQLSWRFSSLAFAILVQVAWLSAWINHMIIVGSRYFSSSSLFHPFGLSAGVGLWTVFKSNEPSNQDSRLSTRWRECPQKVKFTLMLLCLLVCPGAAQTVSPSPTASPSTLCAAGWSYYSDSDGSEGQASCLKVTGTVELTWMTAMSSCPMNSHLLTVGGASRNTGLFAFSRTVTGEDFWIGASQSEVATSVNRGWVWIDGTPASANLNCGAPGDQGCGLWAVTFALAPKYVWLVTVIDMLR
jgi:hypothetical protein